MSTTHERRVRLLRLRAIEHRIAAGRFVAAEVSHDAVARVSDRVAALLAGIGADRGKWHGHDLQSLTELSDRLGRAQADVSKSLERAREVLAARQTERIAANVAETRTDRAHTEAARREAAERELRQAAARSPRLKGRPLI